MFNWITGKMLYGLGVLLGVVTLVFFLFHVLPGDPARMMLGQRADLRSIERVNTELGLDRPVSLQYLRYINDLSPLSWHNFSDPDNFFYLNSNRLDKAIPLIKFGHNSGIVLKKPYLGVSFQNRTPVHVLIGDVLPNTLLLATVAIIFASFFGGLLGIIAAMVKNSALDKFVLFISAIGMSLPSFFSAILFGWIFAFVLAEHTGLNLTGNIYEIDDFGNGKVLQLKNLILPAFTLGIRPLSIVVQLTRNSLLEVLNQDYIRTARAKGLGFLRVLRKHALRNSLNPVITAVSGWFASLMAGVVFVEYIFGWKGLGYLIVDALNQYDMPVVLGSVITIATIFVLVNIFVDLIYSLLDPRIRSL